MSLDEKWPEDFWQDDDDYRDESDDEPDPELEFGCHFPDRCLMPGMHLKCECHTVEMIRYHYYG